MKQVPYKACPARFIFTPTLSVPFGASLHELKASTLFGLHDMAAPINTLPGKQCSQDLDWQQQ